MALWTPAEITTALWLDASDADTITEDNGVIEWRDKSGNDHHFSQLSAGNRPTIGSENGRDTVSFSGSAQWMSHATLSLPLAERSIFVVVKENVSVVNAGFFTVTGTYYDWASNDGLCLGSSNKTTYDFNVLSARYNNRGCAYEVLRTGSSACPLGVYTEIFGSMTGALYVDGSLIASDAASYAFTANSKGGVVLGARSSPAIGSPYLNGEIAGIVYCSTKLIDSDRQKIEGYLAWHWGLQANLPAEHPYKDSAPTIPDGVAIRSILDQPYDLLSASLRAILEQPYQMTFRLAALLDQIYGLRLLATLVQLYGNAPNIRRSLDQYYGDATRLRRRLDQLYGDSPRYRAALDQLYNLHAGMRAGLEQKYSIAEGPVRSALEQLYNLQDKDLLRMTLDMLYVLAAGEALVQRIDQAVTCAGVAHTSAYNIFLEQDESLYHMVGELQLADEGEYLQYRAYQTEVTITVDGTDYLFITDGHPRRSRRPGANIYIVPLASPSILLDIPHSTPVTADLSGMASTLAATLAAPLTVDWRLVDWFIFPGVLAGGGESPIAIIKRIAAAVGGLVQTSPSGVLICRPEYPVSVNSWQTATPDLELTDQDDFFEIDPSPDPRPGYDTFFISNQALAGGGTGLSVVKISSTKNELRVTLLPWSDTAQVIMHHSGGSWVQLIDQGTVMEDLDEQVEIVGGSGRTSRPIAGYLGHDYNQVDLGEVTVTEAGEVSTAVTDNSLLQLQYRTRYRSFLAIDNNIEDVQFYPEVIYG